MRHFIIITILILIFSCQEEISNNVNPLNNGVDSTINKDTIITIDVNNNTLNSSEIIYFVTSMSGEIIASKKLENSKINVLYKNDTVQHETFNVHKFYFIDGNSYYLESYLNTNKRKFIEKPLCSDNPYIYKGSCDFEFTDIPNSDWYSIAYPSGGEGGIFQMSQNATTYLYSNNNYLFTFFKKGDNYYYKYFYDFIPDKTHQISLNINSMNTDLKIDTIKAPEGYKFSTSNRINAYFSGSSQCYYSGHSIYTNSIDNGTKLLVVSPPEKLYKYYRSSYSLIGNENKKYEYSYLGRIPIEIPNYDCDINIKNSNINDVEISTTGVYNFLYGEFSIGTSNINNWVFYTDNLAKISFPKLPKEVLDLVPDLTCESFIVGSNAYYNFALFNIKGLNTYMDFLNSKDNYRFLNDFEIFQALTIQEKYNK